MEYILLYVNYTSKKVDLKINLHSRISYYKCSSYLSYLYQVLTNNQN